MPAIVVVFAVIAVYGQGGWIAEALRAVGVDPVPIFGWPGIVLAHVFLECAFRRSGVSRCPAAVPAGYWRLAQTLGSRACARCAISIGPSSGPSSRGLQASCSSSASRAWRSCSRSAAGRPRDPRGRDLRGPAGRPGFRSGRAGSGSFRLRSAPASRSSCTGSSRARQWGRRSARRFPAPTPRTPPAARRRWSCSPRPPCSSARPGEPRRGPRSPPGGHRPRLPAGAP